MFRTIGERQGLRREKVRAPLTKEEAKSSTVGMCWAAGPSVADHGECWGERRKGRGDTFLG